MNHTTSGRTGLIFDLDDTIYDQLQPFRAAFHELFSQYEVGDLYQFFLVREHYSNEVFADCEAGIISKEEMYIYRMQRAMADYGYTISDEEALLFQKIYKENQTKIYLTDTMRLFLDRLKLHTDTHSDICVGIISNGPSAHQWNKIRSLGVEKYISKEHIFISGDTGYIKPDPNAFHFAAEKLKLSEADSYYIGDNLTNDMQGAQNAGWKTIWMNRRPYVQELVRPDYVVHTEEELHMLIFDEILNS